VQLLKVSEKKGSKTMEYKKSPLCEQWACETISTTIIAYIKGGAHDYD